MINEHDNYRGTPSDTCSELRIRQPTHDERMCRLGIVQPDALEKPQLSSLSYDAPLPSLPRANSHHILRWQDEDLAISGASPARSADLDDDLD